MLVPVVAVADVVAVVPVAVTTLDELFDVVAAGEDVADAFVAVTDAVVAAPPAEVVTPLLAPPLPVVVSQS
jgi:hypothetical protein